jgi:hypothetical protein
MFSSKYISICWRLKFVVPGAGVLLIYTGGVSSLGPPWGRPILAHAAAAKIITAAANVLMYQVVFNVFGVF